MEILYFIRVTCLLLAITSLVTWRFRRKIYPISLCVSIIILFYPYIIMIISAPKEYFPLRILYSILKIVYNYVFNWNIGVLTVIILVILFLSMKKYPRIAAAIKKYRLIIRNFICFVIFTLIYVEYFDYTSAETSSSFSEDLKTTETIEGPSMLDILSRFCTNCISFLVSLALCFLSCIVCYYFYTPIKII